VLQNAASSSAFASVARASCPCHARLLNAEKRVNYETRERRENPLPPQSTAGTDGTSVLQSTALPRTPVARASCPCPLSRLNAKTVYLRNMRKARKSVAAPVYRRHGRDVRATKHRASPHTCSTGETPVLRRKTIDKGFFDDCGVATANELQKNGPV